MGRQIYEWMRRAILDGSLPAGEKLPSSRDLAAQLGVSRMVTLRVYEDLLAEGFAIARRGSGTFVAAPLEPGASRATSTDVAAPAPPAISLSRFGKAALKAASRPGSRPIIDGDGAAAEAATTTKPPAIVCDFVEGRQTVPPLFPIDVWRRLLARHCRDVMGKAYAASGAGHPALREALAEHLRRHRAVNCEASQIVIVNGSQQALDLAARVLIDPGDAVAIEDPHYAGARQAFQAAGARLIAVRAAWQGIEIRWLPKRAKLAVVTPSHQFPLGTILPLEGRLQLLDWARKANALLLEDDYDGEFHYEGSPIESLQGLDRDGRVIYAGTFSRTMFPALRLGYLVAPKPLVAAFSAAKWIADRHTATLEQAALAEFIATGAYARYLRALRKRHAQRRAVFLEAYEKTFDGSIADVMGENSGTHVVMWPRAEGSEEHWIARAAQRGVRIAGTAQCWFEPPEREAALMLHYLHLEPAQIREGIRRLAEVLQGR